MWLCTPTKPRQFAYNFVIFSFFKTNHSRIARRHIFDGLVGVHNHIGFFTGEWKVLCCKDLCGSKKNLWGFPGGTSDKEPSWQCRRLAFDPWVGNIPWRRKWQPTPVFLPGESHGRRSLVGYSSRGRKESDMTERLHSLHSKEGKCLQIRQF